MQDKDLILSGMQFLKSRVFAGIHVVFPLFGLGGQKSQ